MIFLKSLIVGIVFSFSLSVQAEVTPEGIFGLQLFFNETGFVDVLTINKKADGSFSGHMFVPNDFEGEISEIRIHGKKMEFELFVPKNAARPKDLIFYYKGEFFGSSYDQFTGFVTLKGQSDFVASFVGFRR